MRIIRHVAPDTRQALRGIRERLGAEAVIIASRRTTDGVEVTAAVDLDATALDAGAPAEAPRIADAPGPLWATATTPEPAGVDRGPGAAPLATADHVSGELKNLRRMLETQLEQLAWNDRARRAPVHAELLRELTEMGVSPELAERITGQLPPDIDVTQARRFVLTGLSQYLVVRDPCWLEQGGRVALIGATGVGKTLSLAKFAVRWVLRHGAHDLALIAADTVRMGAQEQLQALGQLLGAAVYVPESFAALPTLVAQLTRYRLILIDTPGASVRDPQLAAHLAVLANSASQLDSALVLPANTQAGALEEAVKRFAPANPACCLLTKLDEAASLGGALSLLIRTRLPVAFVSGGQRVPEDLSPARALELVSMAVRLAKSSGATADEDLLRRRFGKLAHAAT
jgi:flagellar biosynthesis protein FlhF